MSTEAFQILWGIGTVITFLLFLKDIKLNPLNLLIVTSLSITVWPLILTLELVKGIYEWITNYL